MHCAVTRLVGLRKTVGKLRATTQWAAVRASKPEVNTKPYGLVIFFDRAERLVDSGDDLYSLEFVAVVTLRGKR